MMKTKKNVFTVKGLPLRAFISNSQGLRTVFNLSFSVFLSLSFSLFFALTLPKKMIQDNDEDKE